MAVVQIKQFREILFWPLELPRLSQRAGQDQIEAFERFFTGKPWQRERNLLERGDNDQNAAESRYAELVYFHPFVQRFLYPDGNSEHPPMRLYRRDNIKRVKVQLNDWMPEVIELDVDRIHFYLFDHGVGILVVEVHSNSALSLDYVEEFLDCFRRAYPPYWKTKKDGGGGAAGHCPKMVEWINGDDIEQPKSNYHEPDGFIEFANTNKAAKHLPAIGNIY